MGMTVQHSTAAASLTRVIIAKDLKCKAEFSDGTTLGLDATGTAACLAARKRKKEGEEEEEEELVRFMSVFARRRYRGKLAAALAVRNAVAEPLCVCPAVVEAAGGPDFDSAAKIVAVHWPRNAREGIEEGMIMRNDFNAQGMSAQKAGSVGDGDGSVVVRAHGNTATLIVTADGLRFLVRFPVEVSAHVDPTMTTPGDVAKGARFKYMWMLQSFSTSWYPSRWKPALELAMEVLENRVGQNAPATSDNMPTTTGGRRSKLPTPNKAAVSLAETDAWWSRCNTTCYPKKSPLWVEWRPEACAYFGEDTDEVEVVVAADGSVLRSSKRGKFFTHLRRSAQGDGLEEASISSLAPPPSVSSFAGSYAIESIVRRACIFLNAAAASSTRQHHVDSTAVPSSSSSSMIGGGGSAITTMAPAPSSTAPIPTTRVVMKQSVDAVGTFTLYECGRVHVKFADRTILDMSDHPPPPMSSSSSSSHATGAICNVILPLGERVTVRAANPICVEAYVRAAIEFRIWAGRTGDEREEEERSRRKVAAEVERTKRAIAINGTCVILSQLTSSFQLILSISPVYVHCSEHSCPRVHSLTDPLSDGFSVSCMCTELSRTGALPDITTRTVNTIPSDASMNDPTVREYSSHSSGFHDRSSCFPAAPSVSPPSSGSDRSMRVTSILDRNAQLIQQLGEAAAAM